MHRLLSIFFAFTLTCQAEEAGQATDFIRVDEDETAARLQTAITTYRKGDTSVSLVGAVHIADKGYYEKLSNNFKTYDHLLFEMIGGEKMGQIQKEAAGENALDISPLAKTYAMIARFLKLSEQKKEIDYSANNFVHADLTAKEFSTLQEERGESLLSFAMKASENAGEAPQLSPERLLQALLSGNADAVKLEIVQALGKGDEHMGGMIGQSVIITDRNKKCLSVLDEHLKGGDQKIGIFYGAAHFPDMEKQLLSRGFKKHRHQWLTAWDIAKD